MLEQIQGCIILPTYNNARTLPGVLDALLPYAGADRLIVVNDGATDQTAEILRRYHGRITLLENPVNKGKGYSLRRGFEEAIKRGFRNAISIDSDGQHFPGDLPLFIATALRHPGKVIMGSRDMNQEGVPGKSSFGNKFSNFWFWVHTGIRLPDTQTGFRLYPLEPLRGIRLVTTRFETEIEAIVRLAWKGVAFESIPIQVRYDPAERVTHFRPLKDFTRISILNTWFFILTLLWYLPKRLLDQVLQRGLWNTLRDQWANETPLRKAVSIGFGLFMGIVPIWGFQLLVGMSAAVFFRLNKALVFLAANISIPPMIPLIIYASFKTGALLYPESPVNLLDWKNMSLESNLLQLKQYVTGAVLLALLTGLSGFLISLAFLQKRK